MSIRLDDLSTWPKNKPELTLIKPKPIDKIEFLLKVIDKRYKDGWFFGRSYYATFYSSELKPSYFEFEICLENYHSLTVGKDIMMTFVPMAGYPGRYEPKRNFN